MFSNVWELTPLLQRTAKDVDFRVSVESQQRIDGSWLASIKAIFPNPVPRLRQFIADCTTIGDFDISWCILVILVVSYLN